jgi:hypothetical protein
VTKRESKGCAGVAALKQKGTRMRALALSALVACAATPFLFGCGKEQSASASDAAKAKAKAAAVEEKVPPYSYAAPVKGHVKEVNIGEFDLADGIAYTSTSGEGTVVYVVEKPIASPVLAGSACPLSLARALAELRNASFAEVTLDPAGHSKYFAAAGAFGGSLVDLTRGDWTSTLKGDASRVSGTVVHNRYGHFDFDLAVLTPKYDEISEGDTRRERKLSPTTPKPTEQALTTAYVALHEAAQKKDLKAMLSALGFDDKQSLAIRGLAGIDADFALLADRFLNPGKPDDAMNRPGAGQVRAEGTKASGKKYVDDYYFDPCGDKLILTHIVEQAWH